MRIIHLADLHAGCYRYGKMQGPYHEADLDLQECLHRVFDYTPDVILIAGDVYDNPNPPTASRAIVNGFLWKCQEKRIHVIIIPGNHDYKGSYSSLFPEEITYAYREAQIIDFIHIVNSGWDTALNFREETLHLFVVGFPLQGEAAWQEQISLMQQQRSPIGSFKLLLLHASVKHAQLQEHNFLSRGLPKELLQEWEEYFSYIALGDIHKQQQVSNHAWYAGSPRKLEFANVEDQNGCLFVETRRNELQRVESLTLGGRPLVVVRLQEEKVEEAEVHGYVVKAILEDSRLEAGRIHNLIMSKGALFCVTEYQTGTATAKPLETTEVHLKQVIEDYFRQAIPEGVNRKQVMSKFKEYYG